MIPRYIFTDPSAPIDQLTQRHNQEIQRHIDVVFARQRPPTEKSINEILGTSVSDELSADSSAFFSKSNSVPYHPYANKPINKMSFNLLSDVIAVYDDQTAIRFKKAGKSADEINFLLDELAYQGMCILLKRDVARKELFTVIDAISKSKYLSTNETMKALMNFADKLWLVPGYRDEMRTRVNLDEKHAEWYRQHRECVQTNTIIYK